MDDKERAVVEAAKRFAAARAAFTHLRVNRGARGMEIAAARHRRDEATNALVDAVEELTR